MGAVEVMWALEQENLRGMKLDVLLVGEEGAMVVFLTSSSLCPSGSCLPSSLWKTQMRVMHLEPLMKLSKTNLSGKSSCKILSQLYTQGARVGVSVWILMEVSLMQILDALILSAGLKG
jgi:hypothetical protein